MQRAIEDHAILGDGRSAALVARDGAIDWLCWPRFDSPSLFAAILDPDRGGEWRIGVPGAHATRAYVEGTNVLATRFAHEEGAVEVLDLMPVAGEDEKRRMLVPEHELVRAIRGVRGAARIEVTFDPRPGYGCRRPRIRKGAFDGWWFEDGGRAFLLRTTLPLEPAGDGLRGAVVVRAGERHYASLSAHRDVPVVPPLGDWTEARIAQTIAWWRGWSARTTYDGPYRAAVERSALALKLLCFAPSGAIVAAPTTSLPESPGGDLNWDYRYCWLRDAAFTVRSLIGLGHRDEARAFASWLLHATRLTLPELSVLYDVYGGWRTRERDLGHLAGWGGARPVRIGNAAAGQLQLDGYGELLDAVTIVYRDEPLDRETSGLLRGLGIFVCESWERPDRGIWELRGPPRAYTHSRVMCWVALDRLIALAEGGALRRRLPLDRLRDNRAWIRRSVEADGWNGELGSYTQALGGDTVDASLLLLGWYGFHPSTDPRVLGTVARVRERLGLRDGLVYRFEESRSAREGAFAVCSFWLVEHLVGAGRLDEATALFEALLGHANDVGLYSEEIEPVTGVALGNFPQAYTHVGLISAALALREARP